MIGGAKRMASDAVTHRTLRASAPACLHPPRRPPPGHGAPQPSLTPPRATLAVFFEERSIEPLPATVSAAATAAAAVALSTVVAVGGVRAAHSAGRQLAGPLPQPNPGEG